MVSATDLDVLFLVPAVLNCIRHVSERHQHACGSNRTAVPPACLHIDALFFLHIVNQGRRRGQVGVRAADRTPGIIFRCLNRLDYLTHDRCGGACVFQLIAGLALLARIHEFDCCNRISTCNANHVDNHCSQACGSAAGWCPCMVKSATSCSLPTINAARVTN